MKTSFLIPFLFLAATLSATAQVLSNKTVFTEADTLRGSLRPERAYDVQKYHLQVRVDPEERFISGVNTISFRTEAQLPVMQVDLFENMQVDSIIHNSRPLEFTRNHNAVFISFEKPLK